MIDWHKAIAERFWSQANKGEPSECWEWQGNRDHEGYGRFIVKHHQYRAHRIALELTTGKPVAKDLLVCHTCDNPPCVNPEHLYIGDHRENMMDYVLKYGRSDFRGNIIHTKPRQSRVNKLHVEQKAPELYGVLMKLESKKPRAMLIACYQGVLLPRFLYVGLKRRGHGFLDDWMRENHAEIDHKEMVVLNALAFYMQFTTYDMLFEYLKTHDWGTLEVDRAIAGYEDEERTAAKHRLDSPANYEKLSSFPALPDDSEHVQANKEEEPKPETREQREVRQRKERISEETEISSKDLVPIEVRYRCRHCGRVIEEGLRDETNTWKIFAICPKCSKVYELSQSEAVAKTERRWSM